VPAVVDAIIYQNRAFSHAFIEKLPLAHDGHRNSCDRSSYWEALSTN
jgi:hypothetical protein